MSRKNSKMRKRKAIINRVIKPTVDASKHIGDQRKPPNNTLVGDMLKQIAHNPNFPIIVTAYTITSHLGDYYKKATARLTKSCIKHDLRHVVYPLKGVGNWVNGCNLKPTVILHALETYKCPILWIDADAEIFKYPQEFADAKFDMALHVQGSGHWLSGTLYFSHETIGFVKEWQKITTSSTPDEITVLNLYRNTTNKPKMHKLPTAYNQVVHSETDKSKLVIGHYIRPDIAPTRKVKAILPETL